jgi:HK97 family phage major capsid protein
LENHNVTNLNIDEMIEKRNAAADHIDEINAELAENPDNAELAERAGEIVAEVEAIDERIATFVKNTESRARFEGMVSGLKIKKDKEIQMSEYRTAGDKFINSDEFRSYNGAGASSRVDVELRATIDTLTEPGSAWVRPDRLVAPSAGFATPLLNAFNRIVVSSNSIEWVTTGLAPEADIVDEGDPKPEATLISELEVINLSTIAHYVSATRQVLEDSPALRSYIDSMLMQGVMKKLDAVAGAALTGATLPTADAADLISAVRVGIGTVQEAGFNPGLVVLNPSDYAAMDVDMLSKTLDGDRIRGTYWGLEVVASSQVSAGTAYVGDFGAGTAFFDRNVASLYVTDSHAENFTSNIITILGEARAAAVISNVNAFAECTITA